MMLCTSVISLITLPHKHNLILEILEMNRLRVNNLPEVIISGVVKQILTQSLGLQSFLLLHFKPLTFLSQ